MTETTKILSSSSEVDLKWLNHINLSHVKALMLNHRQNKLFLLTKRRLSVGRLFYAFFKDSFVTLPLLCLNLVSLLKTCEREIPHVGHRIKHYNFTK